MTNNNANSQNDIVRLKRPIFALVCLREIKCWARRFSHEYDLVCFKWDGTMLFSHLVPIGWGEYWVEKLVTDALQEKDLDVPDGRFLDIEYIDDP